MAQTPPPSQLNIYQCLLQPGLFQQQQYKAILQLMDKYDDWEDDFEFDEQEQKKKGKNKQADVFEQFDSDRKVLKQEKKQGSAMNFGKSKSKSKSKQKKQVTSNYAKDDEYGDDFEDEDNNKKSPLKNSFSKKNNSGSFDHGLRKNKTDKKLTNDKEIKEKKKKAKSSLSVEEKDKEQGRYMGEVHKKFLDQNPDELNSDAINRVNVSIRETIKKYNDILSDLIQRNLNAYMHAKTKKHQSVDDVVKILQEEIKNNQKISQRLENEIKSLSHNVDRLEEREEYSDKGIEEEIIEAEKEIKEKKKELHQHQLKVDNQAKKLVGAKHTFTDRDSNSAEVTILKGKLLAMRKDYEKNEEKIEELTKREEELSSKIAKIEEQDKKADAIIHNIKSKEQKSRKVQQARKKLDNARNHCSKTQSLWKTKSSVTDHENEAVKLKIKNMESQIKNLEDSISNVYEKTQKVLHNNRKNKSDNHDKVVEKLVDEMKVYDPAMIKKDFSTTQMKMIATKKHSTSNLSESKADIIKKNNQDQKNRIWKKEEEEKREKQIKTPENRYSQGDVSEKQRKKIIPEKKVVEQEKTIEEKEEENNDQKQNKPKRFNFKKNRESDAKLTELQDQVDPPKHQDKKQETNKTIQQPKLVEQRAKDAPNNENNDDQPIIAPKRFNLRAKKNQDESYMPTGDAKPNKNENTPAIVNQEQPKNEDTSQSKPMFSLKKRNRQVTNAIENQFIS